MVLPLAILVYTFNIHIILCMNYDEYQLIRIYNDDLKSGQELEWIKEIEAEETIGKWNEKNTKYTDMILSPTSKHKVYNKLIDNNINYKVIINDIGHKINQNRRIENKIRSQISLKNSTSKNDFFLVYRTSDEINNYFNHLNNIIIGKSYQNNNIKVYYNQINKNKPKLLIHGGIHAREWISVAVVNYLIENFINNIEASKYKQDITFINSKIDLLFLPILNVDGYDYTFIHDRLWRKNRQVNKYNKRCVGIDLNRNWSFHWGGNKDTNNDVCRENYIGQYPFEAKEIIHLKHFIQNQTNLISYIDLHSYGQLFMYPNGYTCDSVDKDKLKDLDLVGREGVKGIKSIHNRSYQLGSVCNTIYKAAGGGIDWCFHEANVKYSYAIELRGTHDEDYGFLLSANHIIPTGEEILFGLIQSLKKIIELEQL